MGNRKFRFYYVYQITNLVNGHIYIGCHKTDNMDDGYMGSGKRLKYARVKYGEQNFRKDILLEFNNPTDMYKKERELVNEEFVKRMDTYNIKLGGDGGWDHHLGHVNVKDKDGNTFCVKKDDPRYISGELVHLATGRVAVKDKDGNCFQVYKDDQRYLNCELIPVSKGNKMSKESIEKSKKGLKEFYKTHHGSFTGKSHTDETKNKIKDARNSNPMTGNKNGAFGRAWVCNLFTGETLFVKKESLQQYLENGWKLGKTIGLSRRAKARLKNTKK